MIARAPLSTLLEVPRRLWGAYVAYLWFYQPNSWVGRIASTFRILAFVLVLPVIILTLLDVTSYVIARTLGIVDDIKASTSDADATTPTTISDTHGHVALDRTAAAPHDVGIGIGIGSPLRTSEGLASEDTVRTRMDDDDGHGRMSETGVGTHAPSLRLRRSKAKGETGRDDGPQAYYFAGEEDLRLAGEGVFSPAVSMPPSPITPRMPSHAFTESDGGSGHASDVEGIVFRRRVQGVPQDKLDHT